MQNSLVEPILGIICQALLFAIIDTMSDEYDDEYTSNEEEEEDDDEVLAVLLAIHLYTALALLHKHTMRQSSNIMGLLPTVLLCQDAGDHQDGGGAAATAREPIYNTEALHECLERIGWTSEAPWEETLVSTSGMTAQGINVEDDLERELQFYQQVWALTCSIMRMHAYALAASIALQCEVVQGSSCTSWSCMLLPYAPPYETSVCPAATLCLKTSFLSVYLGHVVAVLPSKAGPISHPIAQTHAQVTHCI